MGKENANAMYTLLIADDEAHERARLRKKRSGKAQEKECGPCRA